MSSETNIAIVRRYFDQVFNQGRHDLADEFLSEDLELHGSGLAPGLGAIKSWLTMHRTRPSASRTRPGRTYRSP